MEEVKFRLMHVNVKQDISIIGHLEFMEVSSTSDKEKR